MSVAYQQSIFCRAKHPSNTKRNGQRNGTHKDKRWTKQQQLTRRLTETTNTAVRSIGCSVKMNASKRPIYPTRKTSPKTKTRCPWICLNSLDGESVYIYSYIYIYIFIYACIHIYIYVNIWIYIYREREINIYVCLDFGEIRMAGLQLDAQAGERLGGKADGWTAGSFDNRTEGRSVDSMKVITRTHYKLFRTSPKL